MPGFDFKNALDYTRWYAQIRQIKRKALSLFEQAIAAAREAGGPYLDIPDNLAQTWQDSAGTIPAAIGSTVGLLTDRSFGGELGPEVVVDTDFDTPAAWTTTNSVAITGGAAVFTAANFGTARQEIALTPDKFYEVITVCTARSSGAYVVGFFGGSTVYGVTRNAPGIYREVIKAVAGNTSVRINGLSSSDSLSVGLLSIKELKGNHATQSTAGNRFLLELYNGHPMLRGNGASTSAQFAANPIGSNLSQPYTIIAGGVVGALGALRRMYGDNARRFGITAGGNIVMGHQGGGTVQSPTTLSQGTPFVAEATWDGTTMTLFINGAISAAAAASAPGQPVILNTIGQSGNNSEYWNGLLLPVFATNSVVPEAQRRAIARGMAQKLGVTYA